MEGADNSGLICSGTVLNGKQQHSDCYRACRQLLEPGRQSNNMHVVLTSESSKEGSSPCPCAYSTKSAAVTNRLRATPDVSGSICGEDADVVPKKGPKSQAH